MMRSSWTWVVKRAADAAVRADGIGDLLTLRRPLAGLTQCELGLGHQRAGRAHRDAVAAVDARRLGQRHVLLGRDVGVEAAPGDGDGEGELRVGAARLDALVAEHALRIVADVEVVVVLDRLGHGGGRGPEAGRVGGVLAPASGAGRRRWTGPPTRPAARAPACATGAPAPSRSAPSCRPRLCGSRPAPAPARPRPRRRTRGRRSPVSASRGSRASAPRHRRRGRRRAACCPPEPTPPARSPSGPRPRAPAPAAAPESSRAAAAAGRKSGRARSRRSSAKDVQALHRRLDRRRRRLAEPADRRVAHRLAQLGEQLQPRRIDRRVPAAPARSCSSSSR